MQSLAERLARLPPSERERLVADLTDQEADDLAHDWRFWARPSQIAPAGDWSVWLILAGRGFGKTRTGAEWVKDQVTREGAKRIALVAPTAADARKVMVEGESGLLAISVPSFRPVYQPSQRQLTWPNGAIATLYSAEEPERLRGPQHDRAWCDELASWKYAREAWDMLQFGLRLGERPRQVVTTTPKPIALLKEIIARKDTVITRGGTYENKNNLAPAFLQTIVAKYEGTRLGRQELGGELLDDVPGSLWRRAQIDEHRVSLEDQLPAMRRVVIGVDPATAAPESETFGLAETGIVVAGLGVDGIGYVLADLSGRLSPDGWARRAISGVDRHDGDAIVAETNQGGAMVAATIRAVRPTVKVIEVTASRGKVTRAEPIAALYEQNRVRHVGSMPELEDQMVMFTPFGIEGGTTGDRVDALVWALTELFPRMTKKEGRGNVSVESVSGYRPHAF